MEHRWTLPGGSSSFLQPELRDGTVWLMHLQLEVGAAAAVVSDPLHPQRETLGEYGPDEDIVLPLKWLLVDAEVRGATQ